MRTLFSSGRLGTILACGLALWAAGAGLAIADDSPPCNCNQSGCGTPPGFWPGSEPLPRDPWYANTDGIALQRIFSGQGPAAYLGLTSTGSVALSQQSLDDPFQAGFQMLVGHTFGDSPYQAEVSYFWLNPLDTSAQAADPTGNLYSPFTNFGSPPDARVDNDSLVQIHLVSRLEGGEINLKSKLSLPEGDPTIILLCGVRYIGLREDFDYSSVPTGNANPVSIHAHTNNSLWGPQIGGQVAYGYHDVWLDVEGKAAICDNESDRDLTANINGTSATHPRLEKSNTAMVADIKAAIVWRPTSALTARIGYQALWIDEVALAARNFASDVTTLTDAASEPPINSRGTLIYHGPFAGLQLSW